MPRAKSQRTYTHEQAMERIDWFKSTDSSVSTIDKWDVKEHLLTTSLFGLLASGRAIMFGTAASGAAISVTVYDGDNKSRTWCTDSVELEDALLTIQSRLHIATPVPIGLRKQGAGD